MNQLPNRITNRLRREPEELLEVAIHHYQREVGCDILAAFPVWQRQDIEKIFGRLAIIGGIAAAFAYVAILISGIPMAGFLVGVIVAIFGRSLTCSGNANWGIVAVTDTDYVLIEMQKQSFDTGQIIEKMDRINLLSEPISCKGGMLSDALPFAKNGDLSWHYAALTDHGTGYISLLKDLRRITMQVQSMTAETEQLTAC